MNNNLQDSEFVIICEHIFDGAPVLAGVRDLPIDTGDSGWQFHCNTHSYPDESKAKVIAVKTLIGRDPSILAIISKPFPCEYIRKSMQSNWEQQVKND